MLAHEFPHIKNQDVLKGLMIRICAAVVNLIMWLQIVNVTYGLMPALYVFSRCFIVQSGFSLIRIFLVRAQEMRADKESLDYLGTNEGAISLLSTLEKMNGSQKDIYYPSPSIRLEAAKNWKK